MELRDVLLIAASGITVVFLGLILTSLMIYSFALITKMLERMESRKSEDEAADVVQPEINDDVAAVIATVLEIERRLLFSDKHEKLTFTGRKTARGIID